MEGRNRSGNDSGDVVKNRSSSGCLIIKKKHHGVTGVGSSKGPKLHESKKEKKRPRRNAINSMSSDEELLEYNHSRLMTGTNRVGAGSLVYESNDFGDIGFGRNELMREVGPKRSQLDVYDFDEYDDLSDVDMMGVSQFYGRGMGRGERRFLNPVPGMNDGSGLDFEGGSTKGDIIYKRRNSFLGGSSNKNVKMGDVYSSKRRFEMRNELPVSIGKEKLGGSDEAIRLQGKNGVLKVRVKHKEEISEHCSQKYRQFKGKNVALRSQELTAKNTVMHPLPFAEKSLPKKPMAIDRLDKNRQKKRKPVTANSSEKSDEEGEDSDSPPKLQTDNVQVQKTTNRGRSGGSMQSPQTAQPVKAKEGKVKRGSGTEKQLLREKIRSMLVTAGWTIDYRPRRGRDYFDAVYVNPTGTAYWSIIKAYDALQKQLEEEGNGIKSGDDCSSFAPISEDVLSKLTRQTRKKIEKELKRKKREEAGGKRKKEFTNGSFEGDESDTDSGGSGKHDDKLSSFMKRSGKSMKGASKESCREGSYSNSKMQERNHKNSSTSNSRFTHAMKSKKIGRCTLLVRNSKKGMDSESDGFIPYTGRRNLLSWLIDSGTVKMSEKVHYMNRRCTRVMLEGWVTAEGIHCGCCSKILTVSKFEIHAASKLRQPYQNIYLSSGASLMQCQVDAWNKQEESLRNGYNSIDVNGDDPNDDTCAICGDGGNLICCDSCPSTFHQNCLGIEMLPAGDWHCPHCSCRFCGLADMSITEGNDRRLDSVLTCSFCEGKFHCSCVEMDDTPINSNSPLFCGKTCQELYECLQKLLGVKHELEAGLCWSLIHRTDIGSDTSVRAYPQKVEWNSKLAVALNVMDECFLPIIDRRSGINMIHSVLYNSGSNISRLDYSGFYTAILEKGDDIVAAASIRIRSTEFAEMPFIGTRHIYRRQGMCRRLFSAVESALRSLKVEKLIIPAISELMDTWTTVFGFSSLQESDKQDIKIRNMLVFPGTDMLLKKLLDQDSTETDFAGANAYQNDYNASFKTDLRKQSHLQSSPGLCNDAAEPEDKEMKDKTVIVVASQDTVCTDETLLFKTSAEFCEEVKPSLPAENEEMNDKSVTDLGSQDIVCTDENVLHSASADYCKVRTSLLTASPHDYNDNKPSLHTAFASVSNEVKPLISNEGNRETTSSELLLDTKFNDTSGLIKDHVSADTSVGNCDTGNSLDDSAVRHYIGVSANAELIQVTNVGVAESVSPPADGSVAAAAVNSLLTGFAKVDNEAQRDGLLFTNDGSATHGKDHSLSEASHTKVVIEKPMIEPTANDCSCHRPEVEVDAANMVLDVFSGSQSLHVYDINAEDAVHEPKIHVSGNASAYGKDHSLSETSHVDVEMSKPSAEDIICQSPEVKVDNAGIILAETNVCSGSQPLHFPDKTNLATACEQNIHVSRNEGEMGKPSAEDNIYKSPEVEVDDADIVQAETNVYSGSQSLHFSGKTNLDTAHEPNIHGLRNDGESSQITEGEALSGKDHSFLELSHFDIELVKPVADNKICQSPEVVVDNSTVVQVETNVCPGSQSLHFPDNIDSDVAYEPYIHVSRNDVEFSQITEKRDALPVDVRPCGAPHNASHSTVAVEKPLSNSYGGRSEQPTLEGEVQHVKAANVQPGSNFTYEVSVDTVDSRAQSREDSLSISNNGGIGVMGLLHVSDLHD